MTEAIKCPICGSNTILRTAKKGPNAGKKFYVCVKYPKCKGKVLAQESPSAPKATDKERIDRLRQVPVSVKQSIEPISKGSNNSTSTKPSLEKRYDAFLGRHMTFTVILGLLMLGAIGFGLFKACQCMPSMDEIFGDPCEGLDGIDYIQCQEENNGPYQFPGP
jgi:hypothetical protein